MNVFSAAFDTQIEIAEVASRDGGGKPTYASPSTVDARVERKREEIVDQGGDEVVSEYILYMDPDDEPSLDARVWLDDESSSTDPGHGILTVDRSKGILVSDELVKVVL